MKTEKGKCNHDEFVQGQIGEECQGCYHHHKGGGSCERCGITLEEALKGADNYCLEKRPHDHGNDGNIYLRETTGWEEKIRRILEEKIGYENEIWYMRPSDENGNFDEFETELVQPLLKEIHHQIASAVEAREMEISEAVKKMKTYTGGSSVNEKDKRVNKAEVLSIINPSK